MSTDLYLHLVSQVSDFEDSHPRLAETVDTMVKKGKFSVPGKPTYTCILNATNLSLGYKEKFGDLSLV